MKIRVEESRPGELQERLDDAIKVLQQMALEKALPGLPRTHTDREARPLDYEVLQASVVRANRRQVNRIKRMMDERIAEILKG